MRVVSREERMPFDCTPVLEIPRRLPPLRAESNPIASKAQTEKPIRVRPLPHRWLSEERIEAAIGVLARARELIADEQRWCKRSFARTWFDIPVPIHSGFARRFC